MANVAIMHCAPREKNNLNQIPLSSLDESYLLNLSARGGNVTVLNIVTSTRCASDLSNTSNTPLGGHLINTRGRYFQAVFGEGEFSPSIIVKFFSCALNPVAIV